MAMRLLISFVVAISVTALILFVAIKAFEHDYPYLKRKR